MISFEMEDLIGVLQGLVPYFIAIAVALVAAIAVTVAVKKLPKARKKFIRGESWLAALLAILIVANLICLGPMSALLSLVGGGATPTTISEDLAKEAEAVATQIAEEGFVLLENEGVLPLQDTKRLNLFGWASTNPVYGGAGSGGLNDLYHKVSLIEGIENAGFEINPALTEFYLGYAENRAAVSITAQNWNLPEPPAANYGAELLLGAKDFSNTALIVISRMAGEGHNDIPQDMANCEIYTDNSEAYPDWDEGSHYLELNNTERDMVELVCANFENVIVVYNGSNAFEFGFVKDHPQIKGLIWAAPGGHIGMTALGEVVSGKINPSAKTVDTLVYDLKSTPWWNNFGDFNYTNMDEFKYTSVGFTGTESTSIPSFVNYVEGIYVGYRFYETAAAEGLIKYEDVVQYPFGYGLSYTTFTQKMGEITDNGETISFTVDVTNTGKVAGKDVIEVYSNPPYTNGGIEKASANLVQFEKTGVIEPGAAETVNIVISKEELMSYDEKTAKGYVLEAGDYEISINTDSHNKIESRIFNVAQTAVYSGENKRSSDLVTATNQFDYAAGEVTYLSRADHFANYAEATAAPASYEMAADAKASFYNISNYLTAQATAADEDPDAAAVTTGAANGLKLVDLRGLAKDDPKWDQLMDQMTLDDMNALISLGGYQTNSVESIGKVRTNDCDGPASINNNFTGVGSIGFPVGVVIAATWNKDLAYRFGESIGKMANEMDVSGWYAPAMNNHRTAFAGRNFEYYSEDPVLSGHIAANAVKGSQDYGVYAYMKHFALNDQEGNRCDMLCTWSNEQAIREIYLKPFEKCVKDAGCQAVMSSFNYIGNRWAGGSASLCKTVLRDEWGFVGFVETDYFGVYGYMSSDQGIRNGSDLMLVNYPTATNDVQFRSTNGAQKAMRDSAKNILYVVANSRQYDPENLNTGIPKWKIIMYAADALIGLFCLTLFMKIIGNYAKRKAGKMK